jgi:hypothetical protein
MIQERASQHNAPLNSCILFRALGEPDRVAMAARI